MIAIIRISGQVNIPKTVAETLFRLNIRRKYASVIIKDSEETRKLLYKIRNYVAYGEINSETLLSLIEKRAILKDKSGKLDAKKIQKQIEDSSLKESDIKPFFRLHPPRGGIDAKKHFGVSKKAVLGDNKEKINELIGRML